MRPRCRRSPARSSWRAAGVETGGAAHNRRFVGRRSSLGGRRRPGARRRSPTIRRPPAACSPPIAPDRVADVRRALDDAGVEHWVVGQVEAVTAGAEPGVALA